MPAKRKVATLGLFDPMQRHPAKQSASDCAALGAADEIRLRAAANEWIGETFQFHRRHLAHTRPAYCNKKRAWAVHLVSQRIEGLAPVELPGALFLSDNAEIVSSTIDVAAVRRELERLVAAECDAPTAPSAFRGDGYEFWHGDGLAGASKFDNKSVDLLLTDPPYGISNPYVCEGQVSRRLRNNGADFIMPKGNFGEWDSAVDPAAWTAEALPKVGGWAVIFCAQAQIGQYADILTGHKFNSVVPMVWQKTNPVPFNHKYKPINSWEALVAGKRPGTKFNGRVVHNVFTCKSPSPQQRIHPTQKPLALMREFVRLFSGEGGLVWDPFGGAATTLIAAVQEGRRAVAYEKDWAIYQRAKKRVMESCAPAPDAGESVAA